MFHTARNDQKLSCPNHFSSVSKVHRKLALHNQEKLVLFIVRMPDELPFELGNLDQLPIQFTHDSRRPVFMKESELLGKVHGDHPRILPNSSKLIGHEKLGLAGDVASHEIHRDVYGTEWDLELVGHE